MKNLFKYAAEHWKSLIAIIVVLFIQAYCDLSLPAYTSDIVNVGIQQAGIEDRIPEAISTEEMERLLLFVSSEDQETVMNAYEEDNDTYDTAAYVLKEDISEDDTEELTDILAGPMMLTAGFESGSGYAAGAGIGRHGSIRYSADASGRAERGNDPGDGRADGRHPRDDSGAGSCQLCGKCI